MIALVPPISQRSAPLDAIEAQLTVFRDTSAITDLNRIRANESVMQKARLAI